MFLKLVDFLLYFARDLNHLDTRCLNPVDPCSCDNNCGAITYAGRPAYLFRRQTGYSNNLATNQRQEIGTAADYKLRGEQAFVATYTAV